MPALTKDAFQQLINDAVEPVNAKVSVLEENVSALEEKVSILETQNETLNDTVSQLKVDVTLAHLFIEHLNRVTDDTNQYSKKQNIIIDGLNISKADNNDRIRELVLKEIDRLKLDIDDHDIDRAHRIESPYSDDHGKLITPVIVRFVSWYARNTFYEARRQTYFKVRADMTPRRKDLLNDAKKQVAVANSRAAEFFAFAFVDRNCHTTVKTMDGRMFKFNSMDEFTSLIDYVEETRPPNLSAWKSLGQKKYKLIEPIIVNLHHVRDVSKWLEDDDHVYVGRKHGNIEGSQWGNPYRLKDHDVDTSLRMYEEHITSNVELSNALGTLKRKSLGCWCRNPAKCHSSVLLKLIGSN